MAQETENTKGGYTRDLEELKHELRNVWSKIGEMLVSPPSGKENDDAFERALEKRTEDIDRGLAVIDSWQKAGATEVLASSKPEGKVQALWWLDSINKNRANPLIPNPNA
ncbi:MAG: hypothetical protein H6868_04515 [Rhodospirillales bacterium]|nr:hypothetical protein [Rhodospirillales bacterium]